MVRFVIVVTVAMGMMTQGDWGGCPGGTLLAHPVGVIANEMTLRGRCDGLGGSVYDCDDYCDCSPDYCDCSSDYFDYDEPGEFDDYPDVYGFVGPDEYGLCRDFHGPGDCGAGCVSQGDAGVVPYGSGAGGSDSYENIVCLAMDRIGSAGELCSWSGLPGNPL